MDFVTKLMSVLQPPVPTITWLPQQQSQSYPKDSNITVISTYGSFTDIANAVVVILKQFYWSNIGKDDMNRMNEAENVNRIFVGLAVSTKILHSNTFLLSM